MVSWEDAARSAEQATAQYRNNIEQARLNKLNTDENIRRYLTALEIDKDVVIFKDAMYRANKLKERWFGRYPRYWNTQKGMQLDTYYAGMPGNEYRLVIPANDSQFSINFKWTLEREVDEWVSVVGGFHLHNRPPSLTHQRAQEVGADRKLVNTSRELLAYCLEFHKVKLPRN